MTASLTRISAAALMIAAGSFYGPSTRLFAPGELNGNASPTLEQRNHIYSPDYKNFAPNLGFAWNPTAGGLLGKLLGDGKTVISASYGINYYNEGLNAISNLLSSNQGTTLESMNLASVWNLPAIFVAENNGYAETTASTWSVASDNIADRAAGFGMPGVIVDGFDFFAVHEAASDAGEPAPTGVAGRACLRRAEGCCRREPQGLDDIAALGAP